MEKLNYETNQNYQSFSTKEEMNQAVRGFLYKHKSSLSDGTLKVLDFISKHSVKVIGVSYARYVYMAEHTGLSRRTVIRAVKILVNLGIIKKIPTVRMNGKQGANLLVIQPFQPIDSFINNMSPQDVTHPVTPNKTKDKQSSLCENKQKPNNVRKTENPNHHPENPCLKEHPESITLKQLDTSFLPESVHTEFIQAAKPFFSAIDIYKLWKRVLLAYKKINLERQLNDLIDTVISAFKQSIFMKKSRKIRSTFEGYFYSVVYGKLIVEKRRENKHLLFDFIGER